MFVGVLFEQLQVVGVQKVSEDDVLFEVDKVCLFDYLCKLYGVIDGDKCKIMLICKYMLEIK